MATWKGTVLFAHGKESGPWGTKIQTLAAVAKGKGLEVESPDYSGMTDPDARVEKLLSLHPKKSGALILVGSSMGGYVSTVASETLRPSGLFLMAPAFYLPGYGNQDPVPHARRTVLVHGWMDVIVPPEHAIRFASRHQAEMHMLNAGHTLAEKIPALEMLFREFLESPLVLPES